MELVAFISTEAGTDLIVSFAVCKHGDAGEVEILTLLRTPKYEGLLPESERGASVSFDREGRAGGVILLREVKYAGAEKIVTVRSDRSTYELDVRKVASTELAAMCRVLRAMNHDASIRIEGA